ncbi:MAG: Gfo/Idh/MocA family oxidoreductase [Bacteroidaceae bacterium]|jgi:predicted dehydrogenase|nr:Gfo/Idh/MocA family oxidoreductase [Bacteroidaceae bacterium]MBQ2045149.1 Gfo/Idh/MocA family oxidoreductase [Bacteroidaceae bacterium]MBQ5374893.1 Gfo/Idh/MocA family oxidoreductase [Bacteroidaceae bacterium]MBQ5720916.1 Gfo/Idh/MocA family oxidoreductase [Bacteroidaceae bacterium]
MKHKRILFVSAMAFFMGVSALAQSLSSSTKWHWDKGTMVIETPTRPAGQKHVLGLTAPKLETVRVGFVGLGGRGPWAVKRYAHIPGVEIVALCDYEEARAEKTQSELRNRGLKPADIYFGPKGYEELCKRDDIDLVYVATDWNHHFPIAKFAMENGKHAAIEVPAAMNLAQCWELIDLAEKTRLHCFILENCCYDYYEMNALAMAQDGVFGEIIRAEGAYIHTLDGAWDNYWKDPNDNDVNDLHWRLKYNKENRGDIYSTHGLGPVAQCMNIHRGDRFTTLVAMDTESFAGKAAVKRKTGKECEDFRNGDHTTTLMRTAQGKVVEIQHNVMTPQPYNRLFKLTGTKGYATKYPTPEFALSGEALKGTDAPQMDNLNAHKFMDAKQKDALMKKYYHPILTEYGEKGRSMGHGGMDYIMDARLVYCLQHGLPLDIDVYDMAEWCCLAELGALSMDNNCAAVSFPDFTRGHWNEVKGFKHAYAPAAEEAEVEAKAEAYTAAQKEAVAANNLWALYDAVRKAEGDKAKAKAEKAYRKAVAKADKQIETKLAAKK